MSRFVIFLGVLALVLGTGGVAKVSALDLGTNITIYDRDPATAPGPGIGSPAYEDNETETNMLTGQGWDLEAFKQKGSGLSIVGGFDFKTGVVGSYTEPLGSLFLAAGVTPVYYGSGNVGGTNYYPNSTTNSTWGYNYAITFDWDTSQYTLWTAKADGSSMDYYHGSDGQTYGNVSNPYAIVESTWDSVTTKSFTYTTGVSNANVGGDLTLWNNTGTHNVISGIDLTFLKDDFNGINPITYLHLTYMCGNDNLMGRVEQGTVPIPGSVLLMGTGLLGLGGLGWRRRKSNA
jgi:hypothetical protein